MDPQAIIENFRRNVTEHYFDMQGRVRRQEFWFFILACVVVLIVAAVLDTILRSGLITAIVQLALLLPIAGLGARRLQDTGHDGSLVWIWVVLAAINGLVRLLAALSPFGVLGLFWFFLSIGWLIALAELAITLVLIYFWAQPGTVGPNQYGPDPKGGLATAAV